MIIQAFRELWSDLCHDARPRPPHGAVPVAELNKVCGLLLRTCRSENEAVRGRAKAALKHANAARALAELGYPAQFVNTVAQQAIVAARG